MFKGEENKQYLIAAIVTGLAQLIAFKLLYPYPDFFSDSYSYVFVANARMDIGIWPIGYSWFLRIFHTFSHSDTALVAFQYIFWEASAIIFFFSFKYLFAPAKTATRILFVFLFLNPLFLYVNNYVNSDPLFASLSLLWITQLIWIIYKPHPYQLLTQALLVLACFMIRNNAYYYPIITAIAFLLSKQPVIRKATGIAASFILIAGFILFERNAAYKLTGTRQFSLFTGWQLANNALYIYDQIKVDSTKLPTPEARELDWMGREFVKTIPAKLNYREYLQYYVGNYFIRMPNAPLKQYLWAHYKINGDSNQVKAWGQASVAFADFGGFILKHYPLEYARYFVLPNVRNYFLPPLEKLELYNLGQDEVPVAVQNWFDYKTANVWAASKTVQKYVLFIIPPIFLLLNMVVSCSLIWMIVKKMQKGLPEIHGKTVLILIFFLLANFGFSIVSTTNVFRYQVFPMVICLSSSIVIIGLIERASKETTKRNYEERLIVSHV